MPGRSLIPLNASRAFEAAGRHCSFTEAAQELHVTPAAISHHVKLLEEFIGTPLFVRKRRGLDLTDAGRAYMEPLTEAFVSIESVTMRLRHANRDGPLRVRVPPCLASKWLLPRLDAFHERWPDSPVEISVSSQVCDFRFEEMDALLRLRCGNFAGMSVVPILSEHVFPVCSPDFLARHGPVASIEDLLTLPLLHDDNLAVVPTFPDWERWFQAAGLTEVAFLGGHRFDASAMAIEAAIDGRGVALGRSALVADDLAVGLLVRPLAFVHPARHDYFFVYPPAATKAKHIARFRDWLVGEAAITAGRS